MLCNILWSRYHCFCFFFAKSAVHPGCRSMSLGGATFPLEQQSKDPQSVVYSGQYDTEGVGHTKSGERQPVQVNIQVRTLVWLRARLKRELIKHTSRLRGPIWLHRSLTSREFTLAGSGTLIRSVQGPRFCFDVEFVCASDTMVLGVRGHFPICHLRTFGRSFPKEAALTCWQMFCVRMRSLRACFLCSSQSWGCLKRCGKWSTTTTTRGTTASGGTASAASSTSASPTTRARSCGSTRRCLCEGGTAWSLHATPHNRG